MKRAKTGMVNSKNLITKAEYARKIKVSQPAVSKMIDKGYLVIVPVEGGELIYCE